MHGNLIKLNSLLEGNPILKKVFAFDLTSAVLVAELYFSDYFFIYYSNKSSNYLLLHYYYLEHYGTEPHMFYHFVEGKNRTSLHETFSDVLEEINVELTNNYRGTFIMHSNKWYSEMPVWLNLHLKYVSESFKQYFIAEIEKAKENNSLYSEDENKHITEFMEKLTCS